MVPKMPKVLKSKIEKSVQVKNPAKNPAFNPILRERDMLRDAMENGSHDVERFQRNG